MQEYNYGRFKRPHRLSQKDLRGESHKVTGGAVKLTENKRIKVFTEEKEKKEKC